MRPVRGGRGDVCVRGSRSRPLHAWLPPSAPWGGAFGGGSAGAAALAPGQRGVRCASLEGAGSEGEAPPREWRGKSPGLGLRPQGFAGCVCGCCFQWRHVGRDASSVLPRNKTGSGQASSDVQLPRAGPWGRRERTRGSGVGRRPPGPPSPPAQGPARRWRAAGEDSPQGCSCGSTGVRTEQMRVAQAVVKLGIEPRVSTSKMTTSPCTAPSCAGHT